MSDSNRITIYRKKQTAFGTQATGNYVTTRIAGETLAMAMATVASDEIESGRMVTDVARTGRGVEGGITCRWSFGAQDDWLISMLMTDEVDTWAASVISTLAANKTLQAIAAGNILRTAGAAKINWSTYADGRWLRIRGFTTNGTEIYCRKVSHTGDDCVIDHFTLVDEAAISAGEVQQGGYVSNGVTERLWSIERKYGDVASSFVLYRDMVVAGMNFGVRSDGLVDLGFQFMGSQEIHNTSTQAGTPSAGATARLMNGVDHAKAVLVDGTTFGMSEVSFRASNAVRGRTELGSLGPVSFGYGRFTCEGELVGYYSGNTNLAKYAAFTDSGLALRFYDSAGNAYIIHWPAVNWTSGTRQANKTDDDVFQRMGFMTKKHSTWGYQMQIQRWVA